LVAAPEVIAALPGMTPSGVDEFLKVRPTLGRDQAAIAAALGPAQKEAGVERSNIFRVQTTIKFASGRRTASEVVIRLGGKEDPYQILSWQDDVTAVERGPRRLAGG
jgi:general secretion pathway protein K